MNGIVRFLSGPIAPAPRVLWPLLMLIALAPRPAEAAPVPAPQESDAQAGPANYELAARFAPYRIREMVHSTSVDPQWIEGTDRFWYEWRTPTASSSTSSIRAPVRARSSSTTTASPPN